MLRRYLSIFAAGVLALFSTLAYAENKFEQDYATWIKPENGFVIAVGGDQLRPLYAHGDFSSNSNNTGRLGTGNNPSVSEGLGYALLLSYAANDQVSFDKFLRFAWIATQTYGCRGQATAEAPCTERVNLMPWMVNEEGKPFMTTGSGAMDGTGSVNYSSGSAADADFQIAWAVYLASQNANWKAPADLNYSSIFDSMMWDIAKFDINLNNNLMLPGASWYEEGTKTFFAGYYTPQVFDIFMRVAGEKNSKQNLKQNIAIPQSANTTATDLFLVLNNTTSKVATAHTPASNNGTWKIAPTDVAAYTTTTFVFSGNATGAWVYTGWQQGADASHLCAETFQLSGTSWNRATPNTPQVQCGLEKSGNTFTFTMYDPVVQDWTLVKEENLNKVRAFQAQYAHLYGLMPNIADPNTMNTKYNDRYGYDATRYPLWAGAYLLKSCAPGVSVFCDDLKTSLQNLNDFFKDQGVEAAGSLPADGYYYGPTKTKLAKTKQAQNNFAGPALNGPALVAAYAINDQKMVHALLPRFNAYKLEENSFSGVGEYNSSPYFEGTLLMLSKAVVEGKL